MKFVMLAGTLVGGVLSDRFRSRTLVLSALLLSATGLGLLPFQRSLWLILACACAAQFAESLMNVAQRLLLMDQVDRENQKEALAWMRMVNNAAQIASFSVAALGARFGLAPLMVFDASTSLGAFGVGRAILPKRDGPVQGRGLRTGEGAGEASRWAFYRCALVMTGWSFFYELFLEGGAGRLEILHPGQGLHRFSTMMILNTVLCAGFAVQAARVFSRARPALAGGMTLTALGILVAGRAMESQARVFGGMFLMTLGELAVGAVSQFALMRLTPGDRNAGFYYSTGLTLMQTGRILGAAAAFPLLIHAGSLVPFTASIFAVLSLQLVLLWSLRGEMGRLHAP